MLASPISSWFADDAAVLRFRRRRLGRRATVLPPRGRAWRSVAPGFRTSLALAASGLPFQVAADRQYDRSANRRRLRRAVAEGKTVFLPQIHQVLPRVMRLMVALRAAFLGPFREECSFLFVVEGRGRPGMGFHHDGDVDAFWLQLEGRRTVTIGPPVPADTPEDLPDDPGIRLAAAGRRTGRRAGQHAWWTCDLDPGTLFYLPPRTPHRVVCHGRSLALSLTWTAPARVPHAATGAATPAAHARAYAAGLTAWDVVSGHVEAIPRPSRTRLWAQVPAVAGPVDPGRQEFPLWTPGGEEVWLPATARALASRLVLMPSFELATGGARDLPTRLSRLGILGPRDLPLRIIPEKPAALDGWQFA